MHGRVTIQTSPKVYAYAAIFHKIIIFSFTKVFR